jgi:RNA recognition motif-containing protein
MFPYSKLAVLFGQSSKYLIFAVVKGLQKACFVEMRIRDAGLNAIESLDQQQIRGRDVTVNEAKPREDRGGRSRNFSCCGCNERPSAVRVGGAPSFRINCGRTSFGVIAFK